MFDILIKGGRIIDPAQKINSIKDIAIINGKIAIISENIPIGDAKQVVNATGRIVTPGLIDMHCHVFNILRWLNIGPDNAGVKQGVTTVVDAGSAGEQTFPGFSQYIIPSFATRVFVFLLLASPGLAVSAMRDREDLNPEAIESIIKTNRHIIKGIKLFLKGTVVEYDGIEVVRIAKNVANKFDLPIMVHIGDNRKRVSPTLTSECLSLMERGDILSHIYTSKFGGVLCPDGSVLPELKDAIKRGVVLDVSPGGQGFPNFSFSVARKVMSQGILPTTISSDVIQKTIDGPGFCLTAIMSIFLTLGLKIEQLIEMSTINPARALHAEDMIGNLKSGMEADISILELLSGKWRFEDSDCETLEVPKLIVPRACIRSGKLITC